MLSNRLRSYILGVLTLACAAPLAAQPLGTAFTYQGQLKTSGAAANGLNDLRFRLYDAATGGAQVGLTICINDQSVADGLFTASLDFGAVFTGQKRFLEIEVRTDSGLDCTNTTGYTLLNPRQELTAAPSAIDTLNLGGTPASSYARLNGNQTLNGLTTFHNTTLFPNASNNVTFSTPSAGSNLSHVHYGITGDWYIRSAFSGGTVIIQDTGGKVGIGTANPAQKLSVAGTVESTSGGFKFPDGSTQATAAGTSLWTSNGSNIFNSNTGNVGIGTNTPGFPLSFSNSLGDKIALWGQSGAHYGLGIQGGLLQIHSSSAVDDIAFGYGSSAAFTERMRVKGNGNVGIGTTAPAQKLSVAGTIESTIGGFKFPDGTTQTTASAGGVWTSVGGDITNTNATGRVMVQSSSLNPVVVDGSNINGTWSAIGNSSATGGRYWQMITTGSANGDGAFLIGTGPSPNAVSTVPLTIATTGLATFSNRVSATSVEIRGGADITEGFDSQAKDIEPGTLMVIDPANPGQLMPSTIAYDSKVAGIISGAGGVSPGIKMGQNGVMDGKHPVAITGRVFVKCTAAGGAIQAGDLLTTSDAPGRAMRASDRTRAPGATIGKAMSKLDSGEGLVLVLVNLQ